MEGRGRLGMWVFPPRVSIPNAPWQGPVPAVQYNCGGVCRILLPGQGGGGEAEWKGSLLTLNIRVFQNVVRPSISIGKSFNGAGTPRTLIPQVCQWTTLRILDDGSRSRLPAPLQTTLNSQSCRFVSCSGHCLQEQNVVIRKLYARKEHPWIPMDVNSSKHFLFGKSGVSKTGQVLCIFFLYTQK